MTLCIALASNRSPYTARRMRAMTDASARECLSRIFADSAWCAFAHFAGLEDRVGELLRGRRVLLDPVVAREPAVDHETLADRVVRLRQHLHLAAVLGHRERRLRDHARVDRAAADGGADLRRRASR